MNVACPRGLLREHEKERESARPFWASMNRCSRPIEWHSSRLPCPGKDHPEWCQLFTNHFSTESRKMPLFSSYLRGMKQTAVTRGVPFCHEDALTHPPRFDVRIQVARGRPGRNTYFCAGEFLEGQPVETRREALAPR